MDFRFHAMLYSYLGNECSDADHIKGSHGLQVSHPCVRGYNWKYNLTFGQDGILVHP